MDEQLLLVVNALPILLFVQVDFQHLEVVVHQLQVIKVFVTDHFLSVIFQPLSSKNLKSFVTAVFLANLHLF